MAEYDVVLDHVYKTFDGDVRAVIDFSAEIERGEFVALLGPSGCGKTTMLRMIGGLEEVTSGKIYILGPTSVHYRINHSVLKFVTPANRLLEVLEREALKGELSLPTNSISNLNLIPLSIDVKDPLTVRPPNGDCPSGEQGFLLSLRHSC